MSIAVARYNVALRAEIIGDTLHGHAAVFNVHARIGAGWEQLERNAFDAVLRDPATDVRALINHDPSMLIGRQSAGTLRISTDSEGLPFEDDLPDTTYARNLRVLVERGDLDGASFGFVPGEDRITRAADGRQLRTHVNVKALVDVSPVTFPAYEGAGVALRQVEIVPSSARSQLIHARHRARVGGNQ